MGQTFDAVILEDMILNIKIKTHILQGLPLYLHQGSLFKGTNITLI